ncbi:hypothetical protein PLICRDRAFT_58137 [Plicaturopsis crispa FD-325 SS-3]|uniref:Unplaced genomic scaffold PLICRscaffold_20, whole genome shotgun sequence n=1 Tax=Plicaturopsis crispa FD-325 SS-3 TaxID=944288 RepID=A0A0C9SQR7_PLICR|nr:hypothetical protein PLICRDRAFT_58137 [Plicaturopsis crispa FD-325 SS-3]
MSYASTSAPSFDLPLPWRDNPIPTSNIQPGVHIELKTSHIAPGMVLWPPPGYPYRVELGFRPDKRKGSGVYNVLFYEMRGRGPPPGDIGYPGDIYLDLTPGAYALYFRGTAEWTQYFLKNRGSARHPLCEELFLSIPMRGQISWQPFSKGIVGLLVHGRAEHLVSEHRAISYLIHEETEFVHPSRLNRASQFDALGPPLKRRKMTDIGTQTSYEDGIASSQHDAGENTDAGEHTDAGEYTGAGEHTERVSPVDISTNSPHAISPDPAPAPVLVKPEPPLPIKSEPKTEPPEWEQQDVASRRGSNVASEDIAEHSAPPPSASVCRVPCAYVFTNLALESSPSCGRSGRAQVRARGAG